MERKKWTRHHLRRACTNSCKKDLLMGLALKKLTTIRHLSAKMKVASDLRACLSSLDISWTNMQGETGARAQILSTREESSKHFRRVEFSPNFNKKIRFAVTAMYCSISSWLAFQSNVLKKVKNSATSYKRWSGRLSKLCANSILTTKAWTRTLAILLSTYLAWTTITIWSWLARMRSFWPNQCSRMSSRQSPACKESSLMTWNCMLSTSCSRKSETPFLLNQLRKNVIGYIDKSPKIFLFTKFT